MLAVAIDTASDLAGVALVEDGAVAAEATWRSRQSHSRQLLPALEWLLQRGERSKHDLGGVIVCLGPGSYAGLRVGLSTAKALAYGLELPVVGIDRLAADAYPVVMATQGRVFAVHAAGRAELAWAVHESGAEGQRQVDPPRLGPKERLLESLRSGDRVVAELGGLGDELRRELEERGAHLVEAHPSRVVAVATLGWRRLACGDVDNADSLVPLYLRAPAIGPQPPRP